MNVLILVKKSVVTINADVFRKGIIREKIEQFNHLK